VKEGIVTANSFSTTFSVDRTPLEVFDAINDVRDWWSRETEGPTDVVGESFVFKVKDIHRSRIEVTELVPGERVVWTVLENHMSFVEDQTEWPGTQIRFDLTDRPGGTQVRFTHVGLLPDHECYDVCSAGWSYYLRESLPDLISEGVGRPEGMPDDALQGPAPESVRG
jgi:uncharacterized protein YndB with AHSA1/START domain